jgi:hypothetical protein
MHRQLIHFDSKQSFWMFIGVEHPIYRHNCRIEKQIALGGKRWQNKHRLRAELKGMNSDDFIN